MKSINTEGRGWVVFIVVLIMLVIWIDLGIFARDLFPAIEQAGQFGDMFGFSNSLFSGLALAGVVIAIWFQREEIKIQREELELNRKEMKEQTKQFEAQKEEMAAQAEYMRAQSNILRRQRIQDSFFNLLKIHYDIVASLKYEYYGRKYHGSECFIPFVKEIESEVLSLPKSDTEGRFHKFNELKSKHANRFMDFNSYLFRIETMLEIIDSSGLTNVDYLIDSIRGCMTPIEEELVQYSLEYSSISFVKLRDFYFKYELNIPSHKLRMRRVVNIVNGK